MRGEAERWRVEGDGVPTLSPGLWRSGTRGEGEDLHSDRSRSLAGMTSSSPAPKAREVPAMGLPSPASNVAPMAFQPAPAGGPVDRRAPEDGQLIHGRSGAATRGDRHAGVTQCRLRGVGPRSGRTRHRRRAPQQKLSELTSST